jgi:hypothetical protein
MPTCCQGATCACKVSAVDGGHVVISGSGQANDPFLISADIDLRVVDTIDFDLTLNGSGTAADPWLLSVGFAASAKLADFPDVSDTPATTGQVLAWNGTAWAPAPPTTAPTGAVSHNATLSGDGSVGTPLAVAPDANRMVQAGTTGVGLNDAGMGNLVRHFADATARNAMTPGPALNSLTMLTTVPGEVDYWDGVKWVPILDRITTVVGAEFLQLSGPYNGLTPITRLVHPVSVTTDGTGSFVVLSSADLSGRAGVLSTQFQETGSLAWKAVLSTSGGQVMGKAYSLTGGAPLTGTPVTGLVDAYCY